MNFRSTTCPVVASCVASTGAAVETFTVSRVPRTGMAKSAPMF